MKYINPLIYKIITSTLLIIFVIYTGYQFSSFILINNNSVSYDYTILLNIVFAYILLLIVVPFVVKYLLKLDKTTGLFGINIFTKSFRGLFKSVPLQKKQYSSHSQDNNQSIDDYVFEHFMYKRNIDNKLNERMRSGIPVKDFVRETHAILKHADRLMSIAKDSAYSKNGRIFTSASARERYIKVTYLDKHTVQIETPHFLFDVSPRECKYLSNFKNLKKHLRQDLQPDNYNI
ncbi:hypothetical protein [Mammaliicoccus sp. E-M21]|uniref:hypothetical protein n=1 Tax=Mammaliicoccus sp. E-M21 TaxID=2898681 RepID=UPI001EFBE812|nr:hypothetical protein [Mammaliicoccus sp. E-M21]